jgi:hypothetical protein
MEQHTCQQEADTLGASIDSSRQPTRLSREVEIQVQSQQVIKHIAGDLPNCLLGDSRKHRVSQFLKCCGANSGQSVFPQASQIRH